MNISHHVKTNVLTTLLINNLNDYGIVRVCTHSSVLSDDRYLRSLKEEKGFSKEFQSSRKVIARKAKRHRANDQDYLES